MRLALVHDWLTGLRGGERVLDALARAYPEAELFTLLHRPGVSTPAIDALRRQVSPLSRWPGSERYYRGLLPLFPWAVSRLAPQGFDLVLSISHAVAKNVRVPEGTPHLCYCLTPMRYAFDQSEVYLGRGPRRALAEPLLAALRRYDRAHSTPRHVQRFVAISRAVAGRIRRHYGREASVVHPPVETERFAPSGRPPDDYFLLVGGFVPYKREDLVVEAFRGRRERLVVAGDGPLRRRVAARAPANVEFVGRLDDAALADAMARCRALIQPQDEDFGLVAVEVQASGRPVIALARGGALDTVRPLLTITPDGLRAGDASGASGILFEPQSARGIAAALDAFAAHEGAFDPQAIRAGAERFGRARFLAELAREIELARAGVAQ